MEADKPKKEKKAKKNPDEFDIISLGDKQFTVISQTEIGKKYLVDMNKRWCECPSFYFRNGKCKHLDACEKMITQ